MQNAVIVLYFLVCQRDSLIEELYEGGLIDCVVSILTDAFSSSEIQDSKQGMMVIQSITDLAHAILKRVSEVVRKAIEAKKSNAENAEREGEAAERLLLNTKNLTDITCILTKLVCRSFCLQLRY